MKYTRRLFVYALFSCLLQQPLAIAADQPPNILYIMMDDLDISDVGVYGSPDVATETIDSVAAQGMRFEQYYVNSPVCAPTEASIITGQHPSRFGFKRAVVPESKRGIPGDVKSVAQILKSAGYRTAHIGKWFMGTEKPEFLPPAKGFDHSVRYVTEEYLGYLKYELSFDGGAPVLFDSGKHLTNALTDAAIEFIQASHRNQPEQPFFLNLWYFAPHRPIELPADFDNSETGYCLSDESPKENCDTQRGDYAALVTHADRQIKRVLDTLDALGISKNTLVLITSDNGGGRPWHPPEILHERKLRGFKAGVFDGGIKVPMIVRWPALVPADSVNKSVIASFDALPTFADIVGTAVAQSSVDGESFLSVLSNNSQKKRRAPLIWENKNLNTFFTNSGGILDTYAIRDGDWKLVFSPATRPDRPDQLMLFNLAEDPGEQHNLLTDGGELLRQVSLFDYRVEISKQSAAATAQFSSTLQPVISHLQNEYFRWRHAIGDILFEPQLSATGVTRNQNMLAFSGGVATVARDTRFDFHDGDFSFLTWITAKNVEDRAVIAEKPGSWQLLVEANLLKLKVYSDHASREAALPDVPIVLSAPIAANQQNHIAFTVFGFKIGGSTVRMFLNGKRVAEFNDGSVAEGKIGIEQVKSVDEPNQPMIYIGNDRGGKLPFTGTIEIPRMTVLSLYPGEVFWDFSGLEYSYIAVPR